MTLPSSTERIGQTMRPNHMYLTQQDVQRLIQDSSPESRIDVLQKITSQYQRHEFAAQENLHAEQIFRLLMRDTEHRVRVALAHQLKDIGDVPPDIIVQLMQDHMDVADPIIRYSMVPSDADLIRLIDATQDLDKLIAISERDKVSGRVSHALIETNYPQVITSLLHNDGAKIETDDYQIIKNDHLHQPAIAEALVNRKGMPITIVEDLIHRLSDHLAASLASQYNIDVEAVKAKAREDVTLQWLDHHIGDEQLYAMIDQMHSLSRLTPSIILSALCCGHIRFFETALAKLAKIPRANARKLIRDKGMLGFEAIYEKTELPESMYHAVRLLLQVVLDFENHAEVKPGTVAYTNMVVEQLLARSGNASIDNLSYLIALVRQAARQYSRH